MRVFVTGASGHVGSALIPELLDAGHEVTGLVRSDAAAATIEAAGAAVERGDLDDLDTLRRAAAQADGVVHLAFKHDLMFSGDRDGAVAADLAAITAIGEELEGTGKPFVTTSGTLMLALVGDLNGRVGTEADAVAAGPRVDAENHVVALADRGVRSSVVRLPPTVHSELDLHGFIPTLIGIAREKGYAGYLGDGVNRWPAGHTRDAARIYRLALEAGPAGSRFHAVGDEGIPFREIAETIARELGGLPTRSIPADEAEAYFTFLALFAGVDNPTSSAITRSVLGWEPEHPGLIEDLEQGHYFAQATA
jgi:nucleoside-diphosphate-sugar epimerase